MKKQTVITVCTLFVILGFTACFCVSHVKNSLKSTLNCARSKEKLIQGFIGVGETPKLHGRKGNIMTLLIAFTLEQDTSK